MTALVSRRSLLAAAGATTVTAALASPAKAASELHDVVIVGSGYAGATAALRLSEAGISSLVLERGRRWEITPSGDTFCTGGDPDGRALWLSRTSPVLDQVVPRSTGVLETVFGLGVVCLAGAGVGGGSLVNNAVMMQPEEADFRQSFGNRVPYSEMASQWYPRARALIGASPIPDDIYATPEYANARRATADLAAASIPSQRADIAVDWDVVRDELSGRAQPSLIEGQSLFGVNSGAKRSVDRTILARAERTGFTTVRPLSSVAEISSTTEGFNVVVDELSTTGTSQRAYAVRARKVILAAGSLNTTKLLLRAQADRTLPGLPDAVGTKWGTGGDGIILMDRATSQAPAIGGPAHVVGRFRASNELPVSLLNFPLGVPIADAVAQESLAVGHVPPVGRLVRGWFGEIRPIWPQLDPQVLAARAALGEMVDRLDDALPDRKALLTSQLLTSHSLGGAVLSDHTQASGQLTGIPGLFVMDSSLIPGSTGGVPPALTVTALADRCVTTALTEGVLGS